MSNAHGANCLQPVCPQRSDALLISPEEGLAMEALMLERVVRGEIAAGFKLWRCQQALVVPRSAVSNPGYGFAVKKLAEQGWPVVVRQTGGDVVPQSPGVINVSFVFKPGGDKASINEAYETLCQPIVAALRSLHISSSCSDVLGSFCDGDYNIVVAGKKLAGTAQRWRRIRGQGQRVAVLAHAAILCQQDFEPSWRAVNTFYRHCNIDYRVEAHKHTSLYQLLAGEQSTDDSFTRTMIDTLTAAIEQQSGFKRL